MINREVIIIKICNAIDLVIESSEPYKGLFPSILHTQTGEMLMEKHPKIPGQRDGDEAHLGTNLIHDEPLLTTMNALAKADLYDITGESVRLDGGIKLAETVLEVYFPETLPYGASGIDWYEPQMGSAFLIHGLERVALLSRH